MPVFLHKLRLLFSYYMYSIALCTSRLPWDRFFSSHDPLSRFLKSSLSLPPSFKSRFYKWEKTRGICLPEFWLVLISDFKLYPFSYKCHNFIFFIAEYNSIVCMEHIISIHSSAQRHLGWIYFLATVNNQEQISTYNYSYKQLTRVIWVHPQVELGDMVFLYLVFLKKSYFIIYEYVGV